MIDTDGLTIFLSLAALLVAMIAVAFTGYQTWLTRATSEVQFNFEVNQYLNSVLLQIADRPDVHARIWAPEVHHGHEHDNGPTCVLAQSLVVAVAVALEAATRSPRYSDDRLAWEAYLRDVATRSGVLRDEIAAHPDWWPVLAQLLESQQPRPPAATPTTR